MLDVVMNDILATPAILVGLFALVGLLIQKQSASNVVSGTLKSILGFVILGAGAAVLIGSLDYFGKMFDHVFHLQGVIPNNGAFVATAQTKFGTQAALIMLFGMVANLLLARFTPFKYIFLSGHHTLIMACLLTASLSVGGMSGAPLIIVGSILLGICMVVFPAILQPFVRQITGKDDFAVGNFGSIGYYVSAQVGKFFGNKNHTTEEINVPKSFGFLRDTSVAISFTMGIIYIIISLFAGPSYIENELSSGSNFIVFAIIQAITFAAGVYIILAGVRMILDEVVPAFKGIADRIVPNAKPAIDSQTVFTFAPNAVLIGFIFSFIAGLIAMLLLPLVGLKVIVPSLALHFFTGAVAGVFGNATGGRRGAILGAFANGIVISLISALLLLFVGDIGYEGTTFGDSDFGIVGIVIINIMKLFGAV
ncbi:PTS ascorbate transporter subunit IIC [Rummeliibacillus sp. JY-2-4R]